MAENTTRTISDEEIQFRRRARRRLIGAIALVLIVVTVVPWILPASKPQQDTQVVDIRIPAQDSTGYIPKVLPAPPAPVQEISSPQDTVEMNTPPAAPTQKEAHKPEVSPAVAPEKKETKQAEAKTNTEAKKNDVKPVNEPKVASSEPKQEPILIQFGAYSIQKNAKQRQSELKAKGINAFLDTLKTSSGIKYRVRSGPYHSKNEAEKIQQKAKPFDSRIVTGDKNG